MDTDSVPLGERAWRTILDHVISVGDEAERSFLEGKGDIDPASAEGVVKVAKFLLGAANRLPATAAHHFEGYAVLVIGATKGSAPGVARGTESHDLENSLRTYLGSGFPGFDFGRLPADTPDREVLFVVGFPPKQGQPPYPCRKDFQGQSRGDILEDGAIYVRGQSSSRKAKSGEIDALLERARAAKKPPTVLTITPIGEASRIAGVDEALEARYDAAQEEYEASMPGQYAAMFGGETVRADREQALAEWKAERENYLRHGREMLLGAILPGVGFDVVSKGRFVAKPQLVITLHNCEAFEWNDGDLSLSDVIEPIREPHVIDIVRQSRVDLSGISTVNDPVDWENRGNGVVLVLTPESLRPDQAWSTGDTDFVIVSRDPDAEEIRATWVLTEQDSDTVTSGGIEMPIESADGTRDRVAEWFANYI